VSASNREVVSIGMLIEPTATEGPSKVSKKKSSPAEQAEHVALPGV